MARLIDIRIEGNRAERDPYRLTGHELDNYCTFVVADAADSVVEQVYAELCEFLDRRWKELGLTQLELGADWEDLAKDEVGLEIFPSI